MPTPSKDQLLAEVTIDPDVMEKTKQLAMTALDEAMLLMTEGSPPIKMQVIRSLMPVLSKALERSKEDNTFDELKGEMKQIMKEVKKRPPKLDKAVGLSDDALEDTPQ